jgi:serine/threonine protein phosphatase PrpC
MKLVSFCLTTPICEILDDPTEPSLSVQRLADAALLAGGRDNISVIVARAY